MGHPAGLRAGTRYAFSRDFRKKGMIKLSTYLRQYKVGDIVDIKANGAVQKGMPHKVYHGKASSSFLWRILGHLGAWRGGLLDAGYLGWELHGPWNKQPGTSWRRTGVIYNVTKSAVGVIIYKKVKHRYIEKRVNLRVEHISLSRSREEFVRRVKQNAELKKQSKTDGTHVHLKRQPLMPREARTISMKDNVPETVVPIAYETTI
ncbi:60S ribosomal protein L21 [Leptodontidium sp. MPI-SDFR-AT-0119]|nr:60S ribosomal protein L21 [Leptodontidium sp. MPI-SDFR-AT-0119]